MEECCRLVRGAKEVRAANPPYFDWLLAGGKDTARAGYTHRFAQRDGGASDDEDDGENDDDERDEAPASPTQGAADSGDDEEDAEEGDAAVAPNDDETEADVTSALASLDAAAEERDSGPVEGMADMSPVTDDDADAQDESGTPVAVDMDIEEPASPNTGGVADMDEDDAAAANPFDDNSEAGPAAARSARPPVRMTVRQPGSSITSSAHIASAAVDEAFGSEIPARTEESALKRRVTPQDMRRVENAATEDELEIIHEHLR